MNLTVLPALSAALANARAAYYSHPTGLDHQWIVSSSKRLLNSSKLERMQIRLAQTEDLGAIWSILAPTIRAGETYALPRDMSREEALGYWTGADRKTFVAEEDGGILGTYYLRPNQLGGGSHIANCGYITRADAQGKGVARRMCEHSLNLAKVSGFQAMQFNLVVSTNERAIQLWERMGFAIVGRLPLAFHHPTQGFVDALVMHRAL